MFVIVHLVLHACMCCAWLLGACLQLLHTTDDLCTQAVYPDGALTRSWAAGGKVEKETDTDSPLDSSGKVGHQFTSDGAVGEPSFQSLPRLGQLFAWPASARIEPSCCLNTEASSSILQCSTLLQLRLCLIRDGALTMDGVFSPVGI